MANYETAYNLLKNSFEQTGKIDSLSSDNCVYTLSDAYDITAVPNYKGQLVLTSQHIEPRHYSTYYWNYRFNAPTS